ncbi:MAG TPA: phage holin family protein, partial [Planctomycetaceae bacterium]|nr:phage holin family protein [Planctomycetaceae bacterium]
LIELIELQFQLLALDLREGKSRAILPLVLAAIAGLLFLASLPVMLVGASWLLVSLTNVSVPAAFLIVSLTTLAVSGILGLVAYYKLNQVARIFARSQRELKSNLNWIKRTLKS